MNMAKPTALVGRSVSPRSSQVCYRVVLLNAGSCVYDGGSDFMGSSAGDHKWITKEWECWSVVEDGPLGPS